MCDFAEALINSLRNFMLQEELKTSKTLFQRLCINKWFLNIRILSVYHVVDIRYKGSLSRAYVGNRSCTKNRHPLATCSSMFIIQHKSGVNLRTYPKTFTFKF